MAIDRSVFSDYIHIGTSDETTSKEYKHNVVFDKTDTVVDLWWVTVGASSVDANGLETDVSASG